MLRVAQIVDDNDDYTAMLLKHLEPLGFQFVRARSAAEGLSQLNQADPNRFALIVTDITMEGQTAGMKLIRQMRKAGFHGILMVASTGFNSSPFLHLCRPFMALWGVDLLVPKEPLKKGKLKCVAITARGREFLQENSHKEG